MGPASIRRGDRPEGLVLHRVQSNGVSPIVWRIIQRGSSLRVPPEQEGR